MSFHCSVYCFGCGIQGPHVAYKHSVVNINASRGTDWLMVYDHKRGRYLWFCTKWCIDNRGLLKDGTFRKESAYNSNHKER